MQVSSSNKLPSKSNLYINKENKQKRILYILLAMIAVFSALFLTSGVNPNHFDYAMSQRIPKLVAIILTGGCIAFSSMIFQTITNNNILTPSVLGLDSLYVLVQTIIPVRAQEAPSQNIWRDTVSVIDLGQVTANENKGDTLCEQGVMRQRQIFYSDADYSSDGLITYLAENVPSSGDMH